MNEEGEFVEDMRKMITGSEAEAFGIIKKRLDAIEVLLEEKEAAV